MIANDIGIGMLKSVLSYIRNSTWYISFYKRYETADKEPSAQLPRCGYKKVGDSIVTKHDREISERNNGKRIMEFPPGIETGDGGGCDMQLSNAVYNKYDIIFWKLIDILNSVVLLL